MNQLEHIKRSYFFYYLSVVGVERDSDFSRFVALALTFSFTAIEALGRRQFVCECAMPWPKGRLLNPINLAGDRRVASRFRPSKLEL